jgi:hypothetical protein
MSESVHESVDFRAAATAPSVPHSDGRTDLISPGTDSNPVEMSAWP